MKRIIALVATILATVILGFSVGCTSKTPTSYQIDRTVIGKVITIDKQDNYSTIYFGDGLTIEVTNSTLYYWNTSNMFTNIWLYKLQETSIKNRYDLVGIGNDTLPTKTQK